MRESILIVGPAWVGDMLMAQSLFKVLKRQQPFISIDVLAPAWSAGLVTRMSEVRQVITHSIAHGEWAGRRRYQLAQTLRSARYQQAIVLPNSWKSALIPFWAHIPKRTGYVGEWRYGLLNDIRPLDKMQLPRTVERFVALGFASDEIHKVNQTLPLPHLKVGAVEAVLQQLALKQPQQPLLALCPGAEYGPAKQWPLEHFAVVAKRKIAEGWQVWIFGSEREQSVGARISALAGEDHCINLCGLTSLTEVIDLLSLATVVISNDSGLMHLAAALNKPLIALYGSSSPSMTPPLSHQAHILSLNLECSPCYRRTCRYQHLNCLRNLKPEQVLEVLARFKSPVSFI
jgi:heptosyltransferase-2